MSKANKVSVIIPTYNVEAYIDQCLTSLVNQTEEDIEIICVDDHSTDKTVEQIERFQTEHKNIVLIKHSVNMKASQSRKDGILSSTGEYIMFVDADDYVETDACERALRAIEEANVDIVQFDSFIDNCAGLPESRIQSNKKAVAPHLEKIEGDLLKACFVDRLFSFTLWNKIYNGDLCRKAIRNVVDGEFPKANDLYAAFYILYYAESYIGVEDELYHYCFGRGMTGHNTMSLDDFKKCCQSWLVYDKISSFDDPLKKESFEEVLANIKGNLQNEQFGKLLNNVIPEDRPAALEIMRGIKNVSYFELIKELAEKKWYSRPECTEILKEVEALSYKPREVRNVALYYRSINNGGAQRVVANVASMLASVEEGRRFRVILVTDEEPQEDDYDIDERITRVVIPSYQDHMQEDYGDRADAIYEMIEKYQIDVVISSMWASPTFFWDMAVIKSHPSKPAVVVHTHSAAGVLWNFTGREVEETKNSYAMADAVVCLSETDRVYWKNINPNVYYVPNQLDGKYSDLPPKKAGGKTILWVGRVSWEKQPMDIINIMQEVTEKLPDAKCLLVGDGSEDIMIRLREEIDAKGLQNTISLEGFHKDIEEYYEKSDLLLFTSKYEGFPLTLFEASAYGLPIVMYDISWIEFNHIIKGYETVPQKHMRAAASKIIDILTDKEMYLQKSRQEQESYNRFAEIDTAKSWLQILDDLSDQTGSSLQKSTLLDELIYFHSSLINRFKTENTGLKNRLQQTYKEKSDLNAKLHRTYREKSELNAKLQQTYKEKSEINAKLKQAYADKSERGKRIKELEKELQEIKNSRAYKAISVFKRKK